MLKIPPVVRKSVHEHLPILAVIPLHFVLDHRRDAVDELGDRHARDDQRKEHLHGSGIAAETVVVPEAASASKNAFFENFANFWRALSRLYQNEILQENMRLTAFLKLYKICILSHRCNLNFLAKICLKKQQFS